MQEIVKRLPSNFLVLTRNIDKTININIDIDKTINIRLFTKPFLKRLCEEPFVDGLIDIDIDRLIEKFSQRKAVAKSQTL